MEYSNNSIKIDKVLNNLDKFVIEFLEVFTKHSNYVVISGYVSILLGRSRISEDVDLLFPKISKEKFEELHKELIGNDFWCLNADSVDELYGMLDSRHSIRYGKHQNPFPNMEIKFVRTKIDEISYNTKIKVLLPNTEINISELNLQIAYKEEALKSNKDLEDAMHIRKTFKENIEENKINEYKKLIKEYGN